MYRVILACYLAACEGFVIYKLFPTFGFKLFIYFSEWICLVLACYSIFAVFGAICNKPGPGGKSSTSTCVRPGVQSEDQNQFFTFKVRTFWQSEVKISVLALWLCALSSLCHNMGVGGYGRNPLFVRARHVQRCVKKCPHFECVIHRFVLALNAGTNTLYTRVYIVSSLWMPGQVGGSTCVYMWSHLSHMIEHNVPTLRRFFCFVFWCFFLFVCLFVVVVVVFFFVIFLFCFLFF